VGGEEGREGGEGGRGEWWLFDQDRELESRVVAGSYSGKGGGREGGRKGQMLEDDDGGGGRRLDHGTITTCRPFFE